MLRLTSATRRPAKSARLASIPESTIAIVGSELAYVLASLDHSAALPVTAGQSWVVVYGAEDTFVQASSVTVRPGIFARLFSWPAFISTATAPMRLSCFFTFPRPLTKLSAAFEPSSLWTIRCSFWPGCALAWSSSHFEM